MYRAQRHGISVAVRQRVIEVVKALTTTGEYRDPLKSRLVETRKAVVSNWLHVAEASDRQGETTLGSDVRHFARHLPSVRTDSEALATAFARHVEANRDKSAVPERMPILERTR